MHDLCPLCLESGVKKKIKLLQINLQEAVWICEEEKCLWPFGYEDFVLHPRVVGKIWSCYWDDYKPATPRLKENVTTLIKPSSCSPALPSVKDTSKESNASLDTHYSENINVVSNSSDMIDSKTVFNDLCTSVSEESNISHVNIEEQCNRVDNISNKEIIIIDENLNDSNFQPIDNNIENIKIENERTNSLDKRAKGKDGTSIKNIKTVNNVRVTPKITSIEKTNIDISNVKLGNQISVCQDPNKKVLGVNRLVDTTKTKLASEVEKISNLESIQNNENVVKSNLNVTMMEIDGLPPITLSFEIPLCTTTPKTVTSNTQQIGCKNSNIKSNSPETNNTFAKRNITSGKQYEKFSFNAIKKKIESSNSVNTNCTNSNSSNTKINPKVQKVESNSASDTEKKNSKNNNIPNIASCTSDCKLTGSNVNTTCVSNQFYNSVPNVSSQENVASDTEAVNTSINIDTVLEDFLTNDYSVSEDINDEWLNSLLN